MLGPDYSTKFSPWLASGSLSPRFIYQEVQILIVSTILKRDHAILVRNEAMVGFREL